MFKHDTDIHTLEIWDMSMKALCVAEKAVLVHDGSKVFGMFGKGNHRSRAFTKTYEVFVKGGRLLFAETRKIKIFFDYRSENRAEHCGHISMTDDTLHLLREGNILYNLPKGTQDVVGENQPKIVVQIQE